VLATAVTSLVVWRAVAVFNDGTSTNILSGPQVSQRLQAATSTPSIGSGTSAGQTPTGVASTPTAAPTGEMSSADETTEASVTSSPSRTRTTAASQSSAWPTTMTTPVVKTWTVTGGSLSVSCQGQVISLVYASPQDGWRVETDGQSTDRIDIDFQRVGQGTEVRVTCVNGTPQQSTEQTDGDR